MWLGVAREPGSTVLDQAIRRRDPSRVSQSASYSLGSCPGRSSASSARHRSLSYGVGNNSQK